MLANKRGRFHPPQELENRRHGAASGRLSAGRTGRSSALPFRRGSDARADALLLQMISAAGEENWARIMLGVSGRAAATGHRPGFPILPLLQTCRAAARSPRTPRLPRYNGMGHDKGYFQSCVHQSRSSQEVIGAAVQRA